MSDWEDEPSNAVASQVDQFNGAPPKSNDVAEWSDCEENNDNGGDDKIDNKTGYRARRDDGGNVFRERRNNGEAGFRGHRHKDNEGVPELFSRFSTGLQVPLTYDKESVEAFIKLPNINDLNMALAKLRKQRDFLQAAFKKLVDNEWETQETSQRAKRKQKAIDLRDAALKSDRIISEINQLIFERDDEQQPNVNWLISSYFTDSFVVPGTPNGQLAQEESNPTATAARVTRTPAQSQRVASIRNAPSEQDIDLQFLNSLQDRLHRLRCRLKKVGLNYEETYDSFEVPEIIHELEELEVSLNQQVPFVFHRCISEEVLELHSMRKMSCLPHQKLREIKVWPIFKDNSIWLSSYVVCKPHLLIKLVDGVKHLQMDQVDVGTSGQINFPRQELSENLVTPDYVGLAMDNQHSTVQENETTPSGATATTPNHSVPSQTLITLACQGNLSQEDAYLMPPPHLPQDMPLETDSAVHPSSNELSLDDNISASTIVRSRIAKPPTPLQSYRHQLPAINEEVQMRSSAGRVLEMSEQPLLQTPNTTLPDFAVPYITPSQRDWSSVFRPRTFAPNYLEDNVPVPKIKRRRRIYERNTLNVNEPVESRSNQEITTAFVTELLQAAVRDGEDMSTANVTQQHITDETPFIIPQVMDNTPPELIQMNLPTFCSDNLPDRPIVTSIEIIRPPESVSLCGGLGNHTIESSTPNVTQAMITPSTRLIDDSISNANDTPQQPLQKQECIQERLYGNNLEDLKFIIKHDNLLRLMVDNYRQVGAEQVQANLIIDGNPRNGTELTKPKEGGRPHYISIPALYTYDPIIVKDMPALKRSVAHSLICALVMQPRVDMRSVAFIKTRMEAAIAFRILLELKAANLINISKDGYISSLCERRRREGDGDMNNNHAGNGEEGEKKAREFYIPPEPTNDETEMFSTGIMSGINFSKYDNIPVKVTGENVPTSIKRFDQAGLREILVENVTKAGYKVPTPIQKVSIPVIAGKRDLMACAQTGSGKTAAFLLPILTNILDEPSDLEIGKPLAVVVSPTRELAIQIFNEARKFAYTTYLKISLVYGGTSVKHQNEAINKGCHLLIATPGRLLDFVERTFIMFDNIRYIVLDEADRMLDMGFSESMRKIMHHQTMHPGHQTLMFSATFPEQIQRLAGEFLKNYIFVTIGVVGGACSDVKQDIFEVNKFSKRSKLMEILREGAEGTIVFVETKRGADFLASFFSETEFPTTSIHGDRLQSQREQALRDFKNGTMKVLIATSVASRGLDIKNVKHVINYDMPTNIDDYVHRIGRTGRVGNSGRATSFFDPDQDRPIAGDLIKILKGSGQDVPDFLNEIGGGSSSHCSNFNTVDVRGGGAFNTPADNLEDEENW